MTNQPVNPYSFRDYILEKLAILDCNQEELADRIHVAKSTVGTWINEGLHPKFPTMQKIASGLGVPLQEVIDAIEGRYKPLSRAQREALTIEKNFSAEGIALAYEALKAKADTIPVNELDETLDLANQVLKKRRETGGEPGK